MADAALKDQLKAIISKATGGAVSVAAIGDDVALMDLVLIQWRPLKS